MQTSLPPSRQHSLPLLLLLSFLLLTLTSLLRAEKDWDYDPCGGGSPYKWGEHFPTCGEGLQQSPIDVAENEAKVDPTLTPLNIEWGKGKATVEFDGETCKAILQPYTNYVTGGPFGEDKFYMEQFHTHETSEHHIDGMAYPMEIHFVHRSSQGHVAVIALFFAVTANRNAFIDDWDNYCNNPNGTDTNLSFDLLISNEEAMGYYTYPGSFTTPPCTENVTWVLIKNPFQISRAQLRDFMALLPHHQSNNRPIQDTNNRPVRLYVPPAMDEFDYSDWRFILIVTVLCFAVILVPISLLIIGGVFIWKVVLPWKKRRWMKQAEIHLERKSFDLREANNSENAKHALEMAHDANCVVQAQ